MLKFPAGRALYVQGVLKKEFYNGISNVTVWRVLRKSLHLNGYKLFIVEGNALYYQYPQLSQVKLGAFCYIMAVQNIVHVLRVNLYKLSKL
jgi:hypothetical protein